MKTITTHNFHLEITVGEKEGMTAWPREIDNVQCDWWTIFLRTYCSHSRASSSLEDVLTPPSLLPVIPVLHASGQFVATSCFCILLTNTSLLKHIFSLTSKILLVTCVWFFFVVFFWCSTRLEDCAKLASGSIIDYFHKANKKTSS